MLNPRLKKVVNVIGFLFCIYFLILSLVLIKYAFVNLSDFIIRITSGNISEINAFGLGWLLTLVMQSSGAATSTLVALNSAGIIGPAILIYMVLGTRIGTIITALFVSLLISAKRRDFRHGFEIGLVNLVYALPIAIFMFLIEHFTSFFFKTGNYFITLGIPFKINFLDKITLPLIEILKLIFPNFILAIFGIIILILSLRQIPKLVVGLWGEDEIKKKLNKYMKKKRFSFWIGFFIALILTSTSITITLLIPLIISRFINLKKVIPYIIGTNLGGIIDVILGGVIIGQTSLPAIFTYVSFSVIGLFWLFNQNLLFRITKFVSKKTLHISKKRAILFVLFFILLAIFLSFI